MEIDSLKNEIEDTVQLIENLQELLVKAQNKLSGLQLQLVNQTPTIRMLEVGSYDIDLDLIELSNNWE